MPPSLNVLANVLDGDHRTMIVLFDVQDANLLTAELDETLGDVGDGIESSYKDPVEKRDVGLREHVVRKTVRRGRLRP